MSDKVNVLVIGVGGAGNSIVNHMIEIPTEGISFLAMDMDEDSLQESLAKDRIKLPTDLAFNVGRSIEPLIGQMCANEKADEIKDHLKDASIIFIVAGMGGTCGTGASLEVAKSAKCIGIKTVVIVTKPFLFEGEKRQKIAEEYINSLQSIASEVIVISNEDVKKTIEGKVSFSKVFSTIGDIIVQTVTEHISTLQTASTD